MCYTFFKKYENLSFVTYLSTPPEGTGNKKTNFEAENPMSGDKWNADFKSKYGKAGNPFEQGGGFSMHYEDEYIQYHPWGGHHGELPYYKISTGKVGTVRYYINGEGVN